MGSCYGSNKPSNEISIYNENLEIFSIIWLDNTLNKLSKIHSLKKQFRLIINFLKIFQNENLCEEYIKQMSNDEYIILIINDQLGEKFLSNIHHLKQIFSIYIYSSTKNIDQPWINQFHKIKSICLNYDEILNQIKIDQLKCEYIKDEILFDIFRLNDSNEKFLYSQILIDTLLEMNPMVNDINEFLIICQHQYKGNQYQLNILDEFKENYISNQAIWWLTRNIFLKEFLNKALKIQNLDLIFLFRFFIHDIEHELQQYQCLTSIQVYKYQLISNQQFELLKNSIGYFISINNFLLTNINRDFVLFHTKFSSNNNEYQRILFEINADFNLKKIKTFGHIITQKSSSNNNNNDNNQNEVLFMLGSIFEIKNIFQDNNDKNLWIIQMTLTSKTNPYLKSIFDHLNNDDNHDDNNINLLSFGYILQKFNQFNQAEKYYQRLFIELPDDDERLACCSLNLGNISFQKNDYDSSLTWLFKSLDIAIRTLQPNDQFLAFIYNSMGHVYNAKNDTKLSIESYNKAIIIWKQSIDENYLNIAECMNNIGIIYKQEKDYLLALECFKKALFILKKYLSIDHIDLSKIYSNIASIYRQIEEYDLALEYYNLSFEILKKSYSLDHLNIAKILGNIGIIYALKGERQKALLNYEKAAEIYRTTLPATHMNNIKIEQLIRNVSSTTPRVSFETIQSK